MRKASLIAILMVSLFSFGAAFAQDTGTDTGTGTDSGTGSDPGITQQQDPISPDGGGDITADANDGGGNAGLWGLAGLIGLAGLMGRSKSSETRDYGARTHRAA